MNWKAGIMTAVLSLVSGTLVNGCFSPDPKSLSSNSAPSLIPAIKDAANRNDKSAIPGLVDRLDDKDSAVRFAAISALTKMTGQDLGYKYYDDEYTRHAAIERWREWVKAHPS
jgi:hypothetical protein